MLREQSQDRPLLVVFPRGQLDTTDKATLRDAGIVAVEADDPRSVVQIQLATQLHCTTITGDALVSAALKALASRRTEDNNNYITEAGRACADFVRILAASLQPAGGTDA